MTPASHIARYAEEFARVAPLLPGADIEWLRDHRSRAMEQFKIAGFPTVREEEWKYTDVARLGKQVFRVVTEADTDLTKDIFKTYTLTAADADELVFVNGIFNSALSERTGLGAGVRVQSLAATLKDPPASLAQLFDDRCEAGFSALNMAFAHEGAYIELSHDVELSRPIHLLFVATPQESPIAQFPRVVITLGRNSRAQIIETYIGTGVGSNFTNTLTHIHTATGAQLEHYKLQDEAHGAFHIGRLEALLARDASLQSFSISLGARLARHDLAIKLDAPGANADLLGLYMADDHQHVDHHTRVDHLAAHTTSLENFRGILDGEARGVFNGKVIVHPDAQKIDARQSNKNLLLSDRAEVDTKPELEIYANDVACTHGATVGQLDEDALFYLLSRGMDRDTARGLLTYAFAAEIVEQIGVAPLRQHLVQAIIGHLPDADRLKQFV